MSNNPEEEEETLDQPFPWGYPQGGLIRVCCICGSVVEDGYLSLHEKWHATKTTKSFGATYRG